MLRWNFVVSRLIMLAGLLLVAWLVMNPLLRWGLIQSGQQAIGAKVEIQRLRSLISKSEIKLDALAVADPASPFRNLFEAESAILDLDVSQLMRRRFVVDEGHLSGIRLNTERNRTGALPGKSAAETGPSLTERVSQTGTAWLDHASERFAAKIEGDLKSVELGHVLIQRWPKEYEAITAESQAYGERAEQLLKNIKATKENPLQSIERYQELFKEAQLFRQVTVQMQQRFGSLAERMQRDRAAIDDARRHDWLYLQEHLQLAQLDPDAISAYLLGPEMGPHVSQLLTWLQWGRQQLKSNEAPPLSSRGWDLFLPGMNSQPSLLVRKLMIDGGGTSEGNPFSFVGSIQGLTNQPTLHREPTTIELRTMGAVGMLVQAVLDHTSEIPQDRITIECPQLAQPTRLLGSPDRLAVVVGPSFSKLQIDLGINGDQLEGSVRFHQPNVQLQTNVSEQLGGQLVANRLATVTSNIEEVAAEIRLGGTLQKPELNFRSNLGSQLSAGLHATLAAELKHRQEQILAKASSEIDAQLANIQQEIQRKQMKLLSKLNLDSNDLTLVKSKLQKFDVAGKLRGSNGILSKWLR